MDDYGGNIKRMRTRSVDELREHLLHVKGIGPETADSILLYGLKNRFLSSMPTQRGSYRGTVSFLRRLRTMKRRDSLWIIFRVTRSFSMNTMP